MLDTYTPLYMFTNQLSHIHTHAVLYGYKASKLHTTARREQRQLSHDCTNRNTVLDP